MHCTRCGEPLPDGARFCGSCGAPVPGSGAEAALPTWVRVVGVGSAVVLLAVLLATAVAPTRAVEAAAAVVAGEWDCEVAYAATDDAPELTNEWEVEFFDDGRIAVVEDDGEEAEGEWRFDDGRLTVDFGDADLGSTELVTETIDVRSSLDELVMDLETEDDDIGDRTLTCERDD